ncbi:MAG: DUF927 domain-containing protein, partial [Selenomonadaceae bacterium]|nr:DUF927 domain-containing protein [Selenomonadaceae bacterium]
MKTFGKQARIAEAKKFFDLLFGKIKTGEYWSYLWAKRGDTKETYPYAVSIGTLRADMAAKAVDLSDNGFDVYVGINAMDTPAEKFGRVKTASVTLQTATVTDVDIEGGNHISTADKLYPPTFDAAKSFLPFLSTVLVDSGYGLHGYCVYDTPIIINDDNRAQVLSRNKSYISAVRAKSGKYCHAVDGVGDLPRVLRVPGTYNYKCGRENAPMCRLVEVNDISFTPADMDGKLLALQPAQVASPASKTQRKQQDNPTPATRQTDYAEDNPDLKRFRIERMLEHINVVDGEYEKWLSVGFALFNEGMECSLWEQWSRTQPDFKEGECESKWQGFNYTPNGITIATLYQYAADCGYDEKETQREWYNLHPSFKKRKALDAGRAANRQERADNMGDDLITTREVAEILGVTKSTVEKWRQRKLFGCYFFSADEKRGDTFYYYRERVLQLKAIYQKGILQNMYKLARRNPDPTPPDYFQKPRTSRRIDDELSFRHKDFFTVGEVADYFGVDDSTVERWVKRSILKEDMLGHNGDLYFGIDNVVDFTPPNERKYKTDEDMAHDAQDKIAELKDDLREVTRKLEDFQKERDAALERLRNVDVFDSKTAFSADIITAGAFARLFDKQIYSDFKRELKIYGDKHKDKKVSVNDWIAEVRDKTFDINQREKSLISRQNTINAEIKTRKFFDNNKELTDYVIPEGYSVSSGGVEKVSGEGFIPVCCRPVIITGKTYSAEDGVYKLNLAYMTTSGKWKKIPPTDKAILFNARKIVDLANADLPVTSSTASLLVDYLYEFAALNESSLPLTHTVNRCGWHTFDGKDYFIDPRRDCIIQDPDEDRDIAVTVDSRSDFAKHLKQVGDLEKWKQAYKIAKKSPIARFIVAAAVAAPLLKILGERNFLLYICAPTRAGKTTALYLGASAIGNDKIIRSFDATKNGLAGAAADVNDYAFLIDEKQVADNRLKEQFDNLVYALANGIGRTKLNKDSTLKKLQDWRTIAIMTGETQPLADNVTGGAYTRLLPIKNSSEFLPAADCKEIRTLIKGNSGLVLPLVIDKIKQIGEETLFDNWNDIAECFKKTYNN